MKLLHQENPNIQFQSRNNLDFPQHLHNVLELVFLRTGTVTAVSGNRRYSLEAGDVFVSFPNQPHGYEDSRDVAGDVLILPSNFLSPWWQGHNSEPVMPVLKKGQWEHTGVDADWERVLPDRKDLPAPVLQGYALVIAGKMLPLIPLQNQNANREDALGAVIRYINAHNREPLSRNELAQAVGYNESYISHLFREQLQTTFVDYLTALRLKDARELLQSPDMTVSQISLMLGFGSIRSFNRAFSREFGTNPTAYRAQFTEKIDNMPYSL